MTKLKEKMSLFTALFFLEKAIPGAINDFMYLMEEETKEELNSFKNYLGQRIKEYIENVFKENKKKELSVPTITNKNKPDPNILLEILKKIKEVERQLFFAFTFDKNQFQDTKDIYYQGEFKNVGLIIKKNYFEKDVSKEKIGLFYKNSQNDKCCSYFTAVYSKIELMRRSFASKFGTNLLLFCRLDLPKDTTNKDLSDDTKNKDLSNDVKTLIESLYTTTSRRGADGFEGFYGGLVDTIKFNQTAFYEVVNYLKDFVENQLKVIRSDENQCEKLKKLVDDLINKEKAEKLAEQIDTILDKLVKEIIESVKIQLKDEKAREINTKIEELVKAKIESLKAELKDKPLIVEEIDKTINVSVSGIIKSVQDKLKTQKTLDDYDLEIWNHLNKYDSEKEILMQFFINYVKYFLFKGKDIERANKAKSYFTKIDSFNIKDGIIENKYDINLKEDLFGKISKDVMVKIVKTCLNACDRETIEEISEGANTEAYTKYNEYVKLFKKYVRDNMTENPEKLIAAGFALNNKNEWVYTTEYKVPVQMNRTGYAYGDKNLPALTHPVMMTAFTDQEDIKEAFYELIRAYDKSWAKQNAGVLKSFFKYAKDKKDLNQKIMSEIFRNYDSFGISLEDLENPRTLYKKALKYKIKNREEEFKSSIKKILSDRDQFNVYNCIWSEEVKNKIEGEDYCNEEDDKEITAAEESTREKIDKKENTEEILNLLKPDVKIGIGANGCVAEQGDLTPRSLPDVISLYGVLPIQMADANDLKSSIKINVNKLQFTRTTSEADCLKNKGLTLTYGINYLGIVISGIANVFYYMKKTEKKIKKYLDIVVEALSLGQLKVFEKGGLHLVSLVAIAAEFEQYRDTKMSHHSLCQYVANQLNNAFRINNIKLSFNIDDVKYIDEQVIKVYLENLPVELSSLKDDLKIEYLNDSLCLLKKPPTYTLDINKVNESREKNIKLKQNW